MSKWKYGLGLLVALAIAAAGIGATGGQWGPLLFPPASGASVEKAADDHHAHAAPAKGLVLSDSAKESLGLEMMPVVLQDYWRSVPVPAEVIEEPGHCEQGVSSTVHGIVLRIHAFHGQTVRAGDPLTGCRSCARTM